MLIKINIPDNLRAIILLPALVCCVQLVHAQVSNTLPAATHDSIVIIKQLLQEHLLQQLRPCGTFRIIEQTGLKKLLKDSTAIDSLSKLVVKRMQQLTNSVACKGKSGATGVLNDSKQILQQPFDKLIQAEDIKGFISQFTGIVRQPMLEWKGGSVHTTGQSIPSLLNHENIFINSNLLAGSWSIMDIPVGMQFMRQDFMGPDHYSRNTLSLQFDREAWLNSLRNKIKLKLTATDLLPGYNDALQKMKEAAMSRLSASLDSINTIYKGELSKQLETLGETAGLLKTDMNVLQDKLRSAAFLQNTEQKKNLLAQMQQQLNAGGTININLYDSLLQSVQSATGVNAIINTIRSFKEQVQKSGLQEEMQQAEQLKNDNLQQRLQDPDKLVSLARKQLDVNGIQQLFLSMSQLTMGMNTVNLSPLTVYQYVNNGFNAAFNNKNTYLFFMAGKQQVFTNLFDNHPGTSLFSNNNTAMGIRFGKGGMTGNHAHVSLFTYKENNNGNSNTVVSTVPGSTLVATFSNQMKLNESSVLNLEISRSSHAYNSQQNMYDSLQQGGGLPKQLMAGTNFMQQMAFTLQWSGVIREKELSYDLQGTRIGKSYTNPGNLFISAGNTAFGGSLKKNFLQSKLQLSAKGNFSEYSTGNTAWIGYHFSFQGKWKLKKGQSISLCYQPYQWVHVRDDKKSGTGSSNRLSLDGNFRKRFGHINYQHSISLSAFQNNCGLDSIPVNTKSVLVSSMQTISIHNKSYYLNMQYNRVNTASALLLLNTQFNTSAGCMYGIYNGIMCSSAISYNSVKKWYRQLGIRQTISGRIGDRFVISVDADIEKNIKEYKSNDMGNSRFDWSLQYLLK